MSDHERPSEGKGTPLKESERKPPSRPIFFDTKKMTADEIAQAMIEQGENVRNSPRTPRRG